MWKESAFILVAVCLAVCRGFSLKAVGGHIKKLMTPRAQSDATTPYQSDKELKDGIAQLYDQVSASDLALCASPQLTRRTRTSTVFGNLA